jgi:hypothetical protein
MVVRIVGFEHPGLIVKGRWGQQFTIAYGEILTAERLRSWRGLRLHTTAADPVRVLCRSSQQQVEEQLRRRGLRIVDGWGAIIAPTLFDFEQELPREPVRVRQSSDSA